MLIDTARYYLSKYIIYLYIALSFIYMISLQIYSIAIHWEEVFSSHCNVSYSNIFEVWTDSTMVSKITSAGYKVIAAPSN